MTGKKSPLAVTGGISIVKPTRRFRQAITIKQVGAEPVVTKRGTMFKLGGGVFTKKQILASRRRYGLVKFGIKFPAKNFGMKGK